MADEVKITVKLECKNSERTLPPVGQDAVLRDQLGTRVMSNTQTVGITQEALFYGDVGIGGYVYLKNLDATNFVSVRAVTGDSNLIKLKPGDVALFPMAVNSPFVIADTAACDLLVVLVGGAVPPPVS